MNLEPTYMSASRDREPPVHGGRLQQRQRVDIAGLLTVLGPEALAFPTEIPTSRAGFSCPRCAVRSQYKTKLAVGWLTLAIYAFFQVVCQIHRVSN